MQNPAINCLLAGLAMIIIGFFPSKEYVLAICLTIVGLTFLQGTDMNRREFFAVVMMGISGVLMLLDYTWWPIISIFVGIVLMTIIIDGINFFSTTKWIIGVCWILSGDGSTSWPCFLAGGVMIIMALGYSLTDRQSGDLLIDLGT